jgi:polysaccharide export outer membrane protein
MNIVAYYSRLIYWSLTLIFLAPCSADAEPNYRLNPGDKLLISVWHEENLKEEVLVLPDGTVSFPLIGHIPAAGKTIEELRTALTEAIAEFIPEPAVDVSLLAAEGNVIYVVGEVTRPGPYVMTRPMDVLQALTTAGGLTMFADQNDIRILRRGTDGKTRLINFSYGDVADGEKLETNIILQSGDTIIVP